MAVVLGYGLGKETSKGQTDKEVEDVEAAVEEVVLALKSDTPSYFGCAESCELRKCASGDRLNSAGLLWVGQYTASLPPMYALPGQKIAM